MPGDKNEGATRVAAMRLGAGGWRGHGGARPAPVAFVQTMPIRALTVGGEEMTCSQSTRST